MVRGWVKFLYEFEELFSIILVPVLTRIVQANSYFARARIARTRVTRALVHPRRKRSCFTRTRARVQNQNQFDLEFSIVARGERRGRGCGREMYCSPAPASMNPPYLILPTNTYRTVRVYILMNMKLFD